MRIRPAWIFLIIAILTITLVVLTNRQIDGLAKPKSNLAKRDVRLFVPSPYELQMIGLSRDIWPRAFGPKTPPELADLPRIYRIFENGHAGQSSDTLFFRSIAIPSTLQDWPAFTEMLSTRVGLQADQLNPDSLWTWVQQEKCSLYGREVAYRLALWSEKHTARVADYYQKCEPQSFHALWFNMLVSNSLVTPAVRTAALQKSFDSIQKRREVMSKDSYEYFLLTQANAAMEMPLAHGQ